MGSGPSAVGRHPANSTREQMTEKTDIPKTGYGAISVSMGLESEQ